jgi:hypothetical protein
MLLAGDSITNLNGAQIVIAGDVLAEAPWQTKSRKSFVWQGLRLKLAAEFVWE